MKSTKKNNLLSTLCQIRQELGLVAQPESREALVNNLADLISSLRTLQAKLTDPAFVGLATEAIQPLDQVIQFLEIASVDSVLHPLLLPNRKGVQTKPKRLPIEIPENLSNQQIRAILEKDLSRAELKIIASQRGISIGKSNSKTIKQDILKNLDRQEGYERLSIS